MHLPHLCLTSILPILPGLKFAQRAACRDEVSRLLNEENIDWRSVNILSVKDASSTASRATLFIEVGSTEQQSRWRLSYHFIYSTLKDCLELDVETIAQDPRSDWRVFAVPTTHPFVAVWPQFRAKSFICFEIANGRHSICCSTEKLGVKPNRLSLPRRNRGRT